MIRFPKSDEPDLDGFSTDKVVDDEYKTVVYINSAKNVEKQNFCAAHELGHRYQIDKLIKDNFIDDIILPSDVEDIMNRFAAELMLPEKDFMSRCRTIYLPKYGHEIRSGEYQISKSDCVRVIIELMNFYYMPYKAVVYRLEEVGFFSEETRQKMMHYESVRKDVVNQMIREMGITRLRNPNNMRQISETVSDVASCLKDPNINKYMPKKQLEKCLKNIGISQEDREVIQEIREMDTEMFSVLNPEEK